VNMQVPTSNVKTKLSYSAALAGGGSASSIVSVSGTNSVCIIDAHSPGTAVITASLVALNSGIVQSSAELLVNVSPSSTPPTYINYTGPTIITLEKGVTKTLSASLSGQGATEADSKAIQWKSSNQNALKITPVSASGVAVNDQIQVTAVLAGQEETVTLSHEKASGNVVLYFIVPGENAAAVTLDRNAVNMIAGDSPQALSAALTNAQSDDIANLKWSVQQNSEVIKISGSGKKINIMPVDIGTATITVTVPSSNRTADCVVTVDQPNSIWFQEKTLVLYPGESRVIHYAASPLSLMGAVTWSVKDSAYVQIGSDDHNGNLTVYGKKEGTTTITGVTSSQVSSSISLTVRWGDGLTIGKNLIQTIPVNSYDGAFDISYEVSPVIAQVCVNIIDYNSITLRGGTYSGYYDSNGTRTFVIGPEFHTNINTETGTANGKIYLEPIGETNGPVYIYAHNPVGRQNAGGQLEPYNFGQKSVSMKIYYDSYTFTPANIGRDGLYSRYDPGPGSFIIGDGEILDFSPQAPVANAVPHITSVTLENKPSGEAQVNLVQVIFLGNGRWRIQHLSDYYRENEYPSHEAFDPYFGYTDAVRAVPFVGTVTIRYVNRGGQSKEYSFPLYVEIRNNSKYGGN
jgi:hypothetical protein